MSLVNMRSIIMTQPGLSGLYALISLPPDATARVKPDVRIRR
jgi:hypothetical protein